jgi:hypothetical protein
VNERELACVVEDVVEGFDVVSAHGDVSLAAVDGLVADAMMAPLLELVVQAEVMTAVGPAEAAAVRKVVESE